MTSRRDFLRLSATLAAGAALAACGQGPTAAPATATLAFLPTESAATPRREAQILLRGLDFPEGPAFAPDGSLWCTELVGGNLVRYADGETERIPTGGRPNGLAFDRRGRAWVCDSGQNAIRRFDPADGSWETLAATIEGQSLQSPNDLCFDALGNLVFTCPDFSTTDPVGYVGCLRPDGRVSKVAQGLYRPNGLEFVDGGRALVVAETYRKTLSRGAWEADTATWREAAVWARVEAQEGPDGMALGADGLLYQAVYSAGHLLAFTPDGQVAATIPLPGLNPTNVAIDPTGKLGLVVTEAEKGLLLSLPWIKPGAALFDGGEAWNANQGGDQHPAF